METKLLLPPEYIKQATEQIKKAQKRVNLIAMVVADHPATHELMLALEDAARRGVAVKVTADIFTYGEVNGGFLSIRPNKPGVKQVNAMVKSLRASGVKFLWLGRGRLTILFGRTHSKWCVVDNMCFAFGGVNIYEGGIAKNVDYMFRVENSHIADRLVFEQTRIAKAERNATNYPNTVYEIDDNDILIDGGIVGRSIIYRRVIDLSKEAESILFVSQYCPTGKLARILKKKPVTLYFNRPELADPMNKLFIRLSMFTSGFKTLYNKKAYLHAKFMVFTMKDGSKVAITGSHNFAFTGVLFGTREIALETKDPKIIDQLELFYRQHVKV